MAPSRDGDPWFAIHWIRRCAAKETLLATVGLFGILTLKLLVIAHGSISESLATLAVASVATAIVGSLISAVPLVLFLMTVWGIFHLAPPRSVRDNRVIVVFIAVVILGCYLSPWPVFATSFVTGILLAAVPQESTGRIRTVGARLISVIAALACIYAVWIFLDAVWLPHEVLHLRNHQEVVGYVLDDGDKWTSVLVSGDRVVVRVSSGEVQSRQICTRATGGHDALPAESESIWRLLGDLVPAFRGAEIASCPRSTLDAVG